MNFFSGNNKDNEPILSELNEDVWKNNYYKQKKVKEAYDKDGTLILEDYVYEIGPFLSKKKCRINKIGDSLFENKEDKLKFIDFRDDCIKKIGNNAFRKTSLTELSLPKSIEEIGDNAFEFSKLKSVNFSEGLKKIGNNAFRKTSLTELILPKSLEEIGDSAFEDCPLESVNFPEGLKKIGNCAFRGGRNITEYPLVIPECVEEIGDNAFDGVPYIRYDGKAIDGRDNNWGAGKFICIEIEKSEKKRREAEEERDRKAEDAKKKLEDAKRKAEEERRKAEEEKRKAEEERRKAEEERRKAEEERRKAEEERRKAEEERRKKVEEEEKRKAEEEKRKAEEEKRKAEEEKRKAEEEKRKAEEEKRKAEEEEEKRKNAPPEFLPLNQEAIVCLYNNDDMKKYVDSQDISKVKKLYIPKEFFYQKQKFSINEIPDSCFENSANLKEVTIENDSVKTIGKYAFYGSSLNKFDIVDNSTSNKMDIDKDSNSVNIGECAFKNCELLEYVNIFKNFSKIEDSVFENCKKLENIIIPKNVTEIGKKAFRNCYRLKSVEFSKYLEIINDRAFMGCKDLKKVILKKGLEEVGESAFEDCDNLNCVEIPSSVTKIGNDAFLGVKHLICNNCELEGLPWGADFYEIKENQNIDYEVEDINIVDDDDLDDCWDDDKSEIDKGNGW